MPETNWLTEGLTSWIGGEAGDGCRFVMGSPTPREPDEEWVINFPGGLSVKCPHGYELVKLDNPKEKEY